jgi:20S proteasome subunit alpha 5
VNTFSPEGRLFQVEYAIEAIKLGSTVVGIRTNEGVILAVEKRISSPLLEPDSVEKIAEIDSHMGVAMSGLTADARTLIEHARTEAQVRAVPLRAAARSPRCIARSSATLAPTLSPAASDAPPRLPAIATHCAQYHRFAFNEPMLAEALTQSVCDLALGFGETDDVSMSRPFGVSLLIAAWDDHGPVLYHTDPSGTYSRYDAKAIGSASEGAQTALQEAYKKDMTLAQAEVLAVATLKQVMEEKISDTNISVSSVTLPLADEPEPLKFACHYVPGPNRQPVFHIYTTAEVKAVMDRLTA